MHETDRIEIYTIIIASISILVVISSVCWLKKSGKKYRRDKKVLALVATVLITAIFFSVYPVGMFFRFRSIYSTEPVNKTLQIYTYPVDGIEGLYDDSMCVKIARRNFNTEAEESTYYDKLLVSVDEKPLSLGLYFSVIFSLDFSKLFSIQQKYKEST